MAKLKCECCGNTYDKAFTIEIGGTRHAFDSFQCAIQVLAPKCAYCSVKIIGHGLEAQDKYFCCAHCARQSGVAGVIDRAGGDAPSAAV